MRSESQAGCIVDWTPMDVLPWESLTQGIPYIGICYSSTHVDLLYERLATLMLHQMKEEGKWYRPDLAREACTFRTKLPQYNLSHLGCFHLTPYLDVPGS